MHYSEISTATGVKKLNLFRAIDQETKKPTGWLRHWDNDNRVAVSIHEDTAKVLANPKERASAVFGVQTEEREAEQGSYTSHRIVMYNAKPDVFIDLG